MGRRSHGGSSSTNPSRSWLVRGDRHEHEHGRHGHEALDGHNEEDVVGIDASVLWRLGTVTIWDSSK